MRFLIDGYNLMHAVGFLANAKQGRLLPARRKLLDWLADIGRGRGAEFQVIFDAVYGPGHSPETTHRGVVVRFATGETADDCIEKLLLTEPKPGNLVLISNDGRLHESARRRGVRAWSCEKFGDWGLTAEPPPPSREPPPPEKPQTVPVDEAAELLKVFDNPRPKSRRN